MPEPIGISGTMDAMNNLNVKTVIDTLLTNSIANQKQQQDEANSHRQAMNTIRESSIGQIVNRMNALDPTEAASIARVHRTPSGDSIGDTAAAISLAKQLLDAAKAV